MKHEIIPIMAAVMWGLSLFALPAQAQYGGGSGTPEEPYLIFDANQMNAIGADSNDWDKHFKLMADIDLSAYTETAFNIIGTESRPFIGVFDGNGHTISNFTYISTGKSYIGLFGYVDDPNAEIKDLGLIYPNVYAGSGDYIGSLVGRLRYGTVAGCYVDGGSVSGDDYVGGLVGSGGNISNCYSTCSVYGGWGWGKFRVDGLVGRGHNITNCYSTGSVYGYGLVGGLVGRGHNITNCYATGSVYGYERVGGLVGSSSGSVSNCYSNGIVSGDTYVGGLVGWNYSTIANCYSTGSVMGESQVGGLVGVNVDGYVTGSFWDIETSGQMTSAGGTGKTTAELQTASTFFAWGICGNEGIWTIDDGKDYPHLWWEGMPGEPISIPIPSYGGGSGEPHDPYLVYTAEQMNSMGLFPCLWDKHFKLMANIDLSGFTGTSFNIIGTDWSNPFTGVFDGNGHTISNFTYISTGKSYIGLFGYVDDPNAEIKDLGLIYPNVYAGSGDYIGSLVGRLRYGTVAGCYVDGGSVSGNGRVGGLVGFNHGLCSPAVCSGGMISNCYATGDVSGDYSVGGLVGSGDGIANCYSTTSVSGGYSVGGLVGNGYNIANCYATGDVSGDYKVGGLVGSGGGIANCYSTTSVSGDDYVGGLVGLNNGSVTASFWDVETSGQSSSAGGTCLPMAEMQMASTFIDAGWDFNGETINGTDDIWWILEGVDYPRLWWEGMQVPMKLTPRTLNCRSYGNWVKAHLTLPEGFTVADVDPDRPAVLHSFGFESAPLYVFVNKDKLVEIEATFEREAVCSLAGDWPQALTVAGFMADGDIFLGTSTVRIIHPGLKVIEELASCWLQGDCVHPTWCDGIDMNRDSLVNFLDYALLMNINVEFVSE